MNSEVTMAKGFDAASIKADASRIETATDSGNGEDTVAGALACAGPGDDALRSTHW